VAAGIPLKPESKLAALTTAAPPFVNTAQTTEDAERAQHCLAEAVYYEARSESIEGQRAVAQVVLNRVRDRAFPRSVCGVVYQGSQRATGCQFTFTCDGSLASPPGGIAWRRAMLVAQAALAGSVYEPVGSATFYHTTAISPWWASSMSTVATIGAHIFYRWRGGLERALAFRQEYAGAEPGAAGRVAGPAAQEQAAAIASMENGVRVFRGAIGSTDETESVNEGSPMAPERTMVTASVRVHYGSASAADAGDGHATEIADAANPS
jgi:hypothetical protein